MHTGAPVLYERQATNRVGRGKNDVDQAADERFAAASRQGRQAEAQQEDKGSKRYDVDGSAIARRRDSAGEFRN